jgi:hypothetical protein
MSNFYPNNGFGVDGPHPQFKILRRHVNRAVQDLFLKALRNPPEELKYIFKDENQIEMFTQRMIKYWEHHENYEVCAEIQKLGRKFKDRWNENPEDREFEPSKIADIFK